MQSLTKATLIGDTLIFSPNKNLSSGEYGVTFANTQATWAVFVYAVKKIYPALSVVRILEEFVLYTMGDNSFVYNPYARTDHHAERFISLVHLHIFQTFGFHIAEDAIPYSESFYQIPILSYSLDEFFQLPKGDAETLLAKFVHPERYRNIAAYMTSCLSGGYYALTDAKLFSLYETVYNDLAQDVDAEALLKEFYREFSRNEFAGEDISSLIPTTPDGAILEYPSYNFFHSKLTQMYRNIHEYKPDFV